MMKRLFILSHHKDLAVLTCIIIGLCLANHPVFVIPK
jgi:hypothetical protein